jgi:hypothetical protein
VSLHSHRSLPRRRRGTPEAWYNCRSHWDFGGGFDETDSASWSTARSSRGLVQAGGCRSPCGVLRRAQGAESCRSRGPSTGSGRSKTKRVDQPEGRRTHAPPLLPAGGASKRVGREGGPSRWSAGRLIRSLPDCGLLGPSLVTISLVTISLATISLATVGGVRGAP